MKEKETPLKKISEDQFKEALFRAVTAYSQNEQTAPIAQGLLNQLAILEEAKAHNLRVIYYQDAEGGVTFTIAQKPRLGFLR